MLIRKNILLFYFLFAIILNSFASAQVVFRGLPNYKPDLLDYSFFGITETRDVTLLNGKWEVYSATEKSDKKVSVTIPSVFEGEGEFIFEKKFSLTKKELQTNSFELIFLGLNYRADISVNNVIIYRHVGGEFPFRIDLSRDILRSDSANILSVDLFYKLDSEITIPLKQRFWFSKNYGGILHDVYIHKIPAINISNLELGKTIDNNRNEAKLNIHASVINRSAVVNNLPNTISGLVLKYRVLSPDSSFDHETESQVFSLRRNREKVIDNSTKIRNPMLWSPDNPGSYIVRVELWQESNLIDVIERTIALYDFRVTDKTVTLNGNDFKIKGVTYIPEFRVFGDMMDYSQFEDDIRLIKDAGFNTVRIEKKVPHPYCLHLCEKYGLLAFIEVPVGMIPEKISQDQNFVTRCRYFLSSYFNAYKKYSAVAAIGLGTTYLTSIDAHRSLLINLGDLVKKNTNWVTYATFGNFDIQDVQNLDMYGLELINELPSDKEDEITSLQNELGTGRIFIASATYTVNEGNSDGYVNKYSYEAQAKYFADLIDYSQSHSGFGYFINSIMDISGDYSSLLFGYNSGNIYNFGLVDENRTTNRLAFKVVSSKLNNTENVTIPIGSKKDDAPMVFILFGLGLALLMGVLVNSGRKFREDASRALLKPYNFYADVRDQRIMSAYHTTFLGVIIVIVNALIIGNILYYLKTDLIFEKLLLAFGYPALLKVVNYLCWHPFNAIVWITIIGILFILVIALIIKTASLFIRMRVYLASIYFTVIWALLPMVFLIPLGIVLYRVLVADVFNVYIYFALIVLFVWILYRLLKGIYVIFDVNPGAVYFYSILFILLLVSGVLFYFEVKNSAIQYILFTFKQYSILG